MTICNITANKESRAVYIRYVVCLIGAAVGSVNLYVGLQPSASVPYLNIAVAAILMTQTLIGIALIYADATNRR